jgi:hypothetical protein
VSRRGPVGREHTRRAIFLAYTYRWIRPRDEFDIDPSSKRFLSVSPVRRQLLGEPAGRHHQWGLERDGVPLYAALKQGGMLGSNRPEPRLAGPLGHGAALLGQVSIHVPQCRLAREAALGRAGEAGRPTSARARRRAT